MARMDETDLDAAVAAGTLRESDAQALRRFVATRRASPPPIARDSHFRYVGGDGGMLPALGLIPLLAGATMLSAGLFGPIGGAPVAVLAWWLSRRFADRREGAATTVLFLAFALSAALTLIGVQGVTEAVSPGQGLVVAGGCALACFGYWRQFRLPIAYAGGLLATLTIGDHLLMAAFPDASTAFVTAWTLIVAIVVFATAMWWDMSDVYRQTIRSDIAFWLHGLAGFKLAASGARAVFGTEAGAGDGWRSLWAPPVLEIAPLAALAALALFACYALVALAVDRRPLLIFGMIFVLAALKALGGPAFAPFAMILTGGGAIALVLQWARLRSTLLDHLPPGLRAQLPRTDPGFLWERPIA